MSESPPHEPPPADAEPGPVESLVRAAADRPGSHPISPWLSGMVRGLDDLVRVPGTRIGFGLDSIIGLLLPAAGDAATGVASTVLLLEALRRKLPTAVIARMVLNIAIDVLGGLLPVVGDTFDLFWKSNRRNLDLIERHKGEEQPRARVGDYAFVGLGMLLAAAGVALPLVVLYFIGWGGVELFRWLTTAAGGGG